MMQTALSKGRFSVVGRKATRHSLGSAASGTRLSAITQRRTVVAAAGRAPTPAGKRPGPGPVKSEYLPLAVQLPNEEGCLWVGDLPSCQIEVHVVGASTPAAAALVAHSVADNPAVCSAMLAASPDWAAIANAASDVVDAKVERSLLRVSVGGMPLMHHGHPSELASSAAAYCREYLHQQIGRSGTVRVQVEIGEGLGEAKACSSCKCDTSM